MDQRNDIATMLEWTLDPAFRVENGIIAQVNQAAAGYFLPVGDPIAPLIVSGAEEYEQFESGCLYLTLSVAGQKMGASVVRMDTCDIFRLEQDSAMPQLKAMSLAAMELRRPLVGAMAIAEQMLPQIVSQDDDQKLQAAQMNRRLHQILRIVNNMSDAATYADGTACMKEYVEIGSFLEEILQKAADLAQKAELCVEYALPQEKIYTLADRQKLERAVYNMLSNAMKFAASETTVHAKLTRHNQRLYFTVTNAHNRSIPLGNIYTRFLREPAFEDPRNGIGLGMVLVRSAAALHGGAVLVDHTAAGMRVTMTMQITNTRNTALRSPIMQIDYSGERDHGLLELSDVLPATAYE